MGDLEPVAFARQSGEISKRSLDALMRSRPKQAQAKNSLRNHERMPPTKRSGENANPSLAAT